MGLAEPLSIDRYLPPLVLTGQQPEMKNIAYGCGTLILVWGGGLAAVVALWKANPALVLALALVVISAVWVKLVDEFFTFDVRVRKEKQKRRRR